MIPTISVIIPITISISPAITAVNKLILIWLFSFTKVADPNNAPTLIGLEPKFEIIRVYVPGIVGLNVLRSFWLSILPVESLTTSLRLVLLLLLSF